MTKPRVLSADAARRIALAAQGFGAGNAPVTTVEDVDGWVRRLGAIQIDPLTVLTRAHYFPLYSRTGAYDRDLIDQAAWPTGKAERHLTEYWAHNTALIPIEDWPLFRFRMQELQYGRWDRGEGAVEKYPDAATGILGAVTDRGPMTAAALATEFATGERYAKQGWANVSVAKRICEQYLANGTFGVHGREEFHRSFDLAERVIPADVFSRKPSNEDAFVQLVRQASSALGVATAADLAEYYQLKPAQASSAIEKLTAAGELEPVAVEGWQDQAYVDPKATDPGRIEGSALISPFDSLLFSHDRIQRVFDFTYLLEVYVPPAKRQYGYYVYPLLVDGALVARVDLRHAPGEHGGEVVQVESAHIEAGCDAKTTAKALATQLDSLANWLGLDGVRVLDQGSLAQDLAKAVG